VPKPNGAPTLESVARWPGCLGLPQAGCSQAEPAAHNRSSAPKRRSSGPQTAVWLRNADPAGCKPQFGSETQIQRGANRSLAPKRRSRRVHGGPGRTEPAAAWVAVTHGLATAAVRKAAPAARVAVTRNLAWVRPRPVPYWTRTPPAGWTGCRTGYSRHWTRELPPGRPRTGTAQGGQPVARMRRRGVPHQPGPETDMGWSIDARGLTELLPRVARERPGPDLLVTEKRSGLPGRVATGRAGGGSGACGVPAARTWTPCTTRSRRPPR
jgi:hypothetical protein